jgi:hypothetical protein
VVLFQPGTDFAENVTTMADDIDPSIAPPDAQVFQLNSGADIWINVNDETPDPGYSDNWGAYGLMVEILQS